MKTKFFGWVSVLSLILVSVAFLPHKAFAGDQIENSMEIDQILVTLRPQIRSIVQKKTGQYVDLLLISPSYYNSAEAKTANAIINVSAMDDSYNGEFELKGLTPSNVREKVREVEALLVKNINSEKNEIVSNENMVMTIAGHGSSVMGTFNPQISLSVGVPVYTSVWVEIPGFNGTKGTVLDNPAQSKWMSTAFSIQGVLHDKTSPGQPRVAVAQAQTTIYSVKITNAPDWNGMDGVIRLGTVRGAIRMQNGQSAYGRLEMDLGGVGFTRSIRASQAVTVAFNEAVSLGLRFMEKNAQVLRVYCHETLGLGVILFNRFYVGGGLDTELSPKANYGTFSVKGGWRLSSKVVLQAALNYRLTESKDSPADPFYLLPRGWSFVTSIATQF